VHRSCASRVVTLSHCVHLLRPGDHIKASAAFECALALDPTNDLAWCDYGNVFRDQGRTDDCERCCLTALDLNPRLAVAWNNLGCAALDSANADKASDHFIKALFEDPNLEVSRVDNTCPPVFPPWRLALTFGSISHSVNRERTYSRWCFSVGGISELIWAEGSHGQLGGASRTGLPAC
jgi:tetratricopeptide (TPR) repeat protein